MHYAIIVAGGSGTRMQSILPKQFLELNGKPVLMYTLEAFLPIAPHRRSLFCVLTRELSCPVERALRCA
jgi:2-C-methyl-D-erythritol 4-phosphate cytidylyltransferase